MSKPQIQSWIASTSPQDIDIDIDGDFETDVRWEGAQRDWPAFLCYAQSVLLSGKTKLRRQFLKEQLLPLSQHNDLSFDQILDIYRLLTLTYPRYVDSASREAVELVGEELVRHDEVRGLQGSSSSESKLGVTEHIVGWLSAESGRVHKRGSAGSSAPANQYVLLSWCCGLYVVCLQSNTRFTTTRSWGLLVDAMALLLDSLLDPSTHAKSSLSRSAVMRTSRAMRSSPDNIPNLILTLLTKAKSHSSPIILVPIIGIACNVMVRLRKVIHAQGQSSETLKDGLLQFYTSSVLMSKVPVPPYASKCLKDFIRCLTQDTDLTETILPAMEKATLRSPEIALPVMTDFFLAYDHTLSMKTFRQVLTLLVNSTKSSNPKTRTSAIDLFKVLMGRNADLPNVELAVNEVLSAPRAGKTTGPEHRLALYSMLACLSAGSQTSEVLIGALPSLLAKETNDNAVSVLASALVPHLAYQLKIGSEVQRDVLNFITKDMTNSKPILRRSLCSLAGNVLWECADIPSDAVRNFATALIPALESNLKNVASNPLNAIAGPLEGYVALASLLGPLSQYSEFDNVVSRNATIQSLTNPSTKPSFLLWDKVYQKLNDSEDETWLLRALRVTLSFLKNDLIKNEPLRIQVGLVFIHLASQGQNIDIRRLVLRTLEEENAASPRVVNRVLRDSMSVCLSREKEKSFHDGGADNETQALHSKRGRLISILATCASFHSSTNLADKQNLIADLVILAHHPIICTKSRQTWIDLCLKAKLDIPELVATNLDRLLDMILHNVKSNQQSMTRDACYRAASTLTFVAPALVLPRLMTQVKDDLDQKKVNSLSDTDFAIWRTPEGTPYVDVLSTKKVTNSKGKNSAIDKWEAELRSSLSNKKSASASRTLSKEDQALVDAQLKKESEVRRRVSAVKTDFERGLALIRSAVEAGTDDFCAYMSMVVNLVLEVAVKGGSSLVSTEAFETYLTLSRCCSERLGHFKMWLGVATFRCLNIEGIPTELQAEPLNALAIRVLYRLRSLSEQSPLDGATFSYSSPLLSKVISTGGISSDKEDDPLEQIALALDITKYHCGEFSDPIFPREQAMKNLLLIIKQHPQLGQDAASALVELGQAIHASATEEEVDVLIRNTLTQEVYVRNTVLQCLQPFDLTDLDWSSELWIACHDNDQPNARLARHVWDDNGLDVPDSFFDELHPFLGHENAYVRSSCAVSFAEATEHWPHLIGAVVKSLGELYREKAKVLAPEFDQYGILISQSVDRTDPWPARLAIAQALEAVAPLFSDDLIEPFFTFLIDEEVLGDRHAHVRRGMLSAASTVIDLHGTKSLQTLIWMFEKYLGSTIPPTETGDHMKEAIVILFGRVARHMNANDPRIPEVVDRLVDALKTPSEQVQLAVSECLAPLAGFMKNTDSNLIDNLLDQLFNASKYGERRGAAYGLAGVVKGLGISSLKEFDIINRLTAAMDDKKRYEPRQGVMFAFETLSATLGRNFEPYVIQLLPLLLTSFGDSSLNAREATQDTARVIMANLSGYGVKLILPSLMSGLEEKQWRSKKGSIELLGAMAFCAPKQLSLSLPTVIPRLTSVLTDSHAQVRAAANKSLKEFGEVINNPEIQSLVPVLLKALVDPAKTPNALTSLIKTSFMHYIDSPSLALVMPIIERGLRERSADTKRKASQIVGNLASLTDAQDFIPYLSRLLPLVHVVLVDPVPEARATAAKALGTLIERLGEEHFPDMVPGLLRTLKTDTSGVDRQGAAQGLSEVLAGLGMERLEALLPDIVSNAQSPRSTVREGFMSLLVYLPATFGTRFQPHIPKIITPILSGLSDTEEFVREAAMRAGRMVISNYSTKAIDLLLPELERGMFDSSWRIRHSSITLVGELLFKVSGISGKAEIEEDEDTTQVIVAESSRKALVEVLGKERRDRVLSAFYIIRQDAVNVVRQSAIHIWKVLVQNTPRTVRELLPELVSQVVSFLTDQSVETQETAARTMGELCRKLGERILGEIVPILQASSTSPDSQTREGVCLTLIEVMENTSESQREDHDDNIVAIVRNSLVDDNANVRQAAARAFDALQEHLGPRAIDQTIPTLLEALRQPGESAGTALQALKEVMTVRANTVFPILIPTLTATPMTLFNARALASLVTVAGNALSKRLTLILTALIKPPETVRDEELKAAIEEAIRASLGSIADSEGLNTLMMLLLGWAKSDAPSQRISACHLFGMFCEESELDDSLYRIDWIRELTSLLDDRQEAVHVAAWQALDKFVKSVPKDELEPLVVPLRRTIDSTGAPGRYVPGFSLLKGVAPMVPIIIAGLITGSNEQREQAAYAIGDLVEKTEETAIKPFVVPFTGPLIRVATQATTYPPGVKSAILHALTVMLAKIPAFVKPFFPQLQRTFVKSVSDSSSLAVRNKAGAALGTLMLSQPRVDPVVTELIGGAKSSDEEIAASLVGALANVVKSARTNLGDKAREACVEVIADAFKETHDEHYVQSVAALFASLSIFPDLLQPVVNSYLLHGTPPSVLSSQIILAVFSAEDDTDSSSSESSQNIFQQLDVLSSISEKIQESIGNERPAISRPAREARDLMKLLDDRQEN